MAALVKHRPGNYLAFFPSYRYMEAVLSEMEPSDEYELMVQSPSMKEGERERFLESFCAERPKSLIGFVVMGGIFGESIDLAGDRLNGAVVVGTGLPAICAERELIRGYYSEAGRGEGSIPAKDAYLYAYVYPGMNRVLQAAGRVIRTSGDTGVVLLIDDRFGYGANRELLPPYWNTRFVSTAAEVGTAIEDWRKERCR